MKTMLFTLAAVTGLALSFASPAFATPPHAHNNVSHGIVHRGSPSVVLHVRTPVTQIRIGGPVRTANFNNYHLNYGVRFSGGYLYRGRDHGHFSVQRFDARYRTTCYWDPYARNWFYFCVPDNCYYPLGYCPYRTYNFTPGMIQPLPMPLPLPQPLPVPPVDPNQIPPVDPNVPPIPAPVVPN